MQNQTDIEIHLLKLLQHDEGKAVELLFNMYYAPLCKRVNRIINNCVVSEDIIQDVFYSFWEKRKRIKIDLSVSAYLNRMALNAAFTYIRKVKHVSIQELNEQMAYTSKLVNREKCDENYMFRELQEKVCRLVESLPPKCKLIFTMSRYEEMSNRQIAEQLSISVKTVENQMTKALRIFRNNLLILVSIFTILF
ncbi:MAG: RNA polymerase sigma-70 factor [Bacteroidia bacterium]|nr:RNA polymerase sigma-70 factor [Bacteroidia bacterium]